MEGDQRVKNEKPLTGVKGHQAIAPAPMIEPKVATAGFEPATKGL